MSVKCNEKHFSTLTENSKGEFSCSEHRDVIEDSISKDLALGRKAGPFTDPPFENFVGSPMGVYEKKRSPGKFRIIHDLSWPPGRSVNDGINPDDYSLQYISIDQAVNLVKQYGQDTLMSKIDLKDAFKHIVVRPEDWELLGTSWTRRNHNGYEQTEYYIDTVLPFGCRSSPKLFNDYAEALQYAMLNNGATCVEHYLDDYFTCGPQDSNICYTNLDTMLAICQKLGFSVQPSKVVKPTTCIEFLGIIIDSSKMELRISQERMVYLAAVRSLHVEEGFPNPLEDRHRLKRALNCVKIEGGPPKKKLPITFSILANVLNYISSNYNHKLIWAAMTLAYFACLRAAEFCVRNKFDPAVNLTMDDIKLNSNHLVLHLKSSKTDKFRQGVNIYVGCSGTRVCSFCPMLEYLKE